MTILTRFSDENVRESHHLRCNPEATGIEHAKTLVTGYLRHATSMIRRSPFAGQPLPAALPLPYRRGVALPEDR